MTASQTMLTGWISSGRVVAWLFVLGMAMLSPTLAEAAGSDSGDTACGPISDVPHSDTLSGPAFSNPRCINPKPKSWREAPIQYDYWAKEADLALTLDQHLYSALSPLAKAFAREKGINIAVKEGTCGVSQGLLNRKRVDMAGFCCPPATTDRLPGLRFHTLGISALAIITHTDNPVDGLSSDQVREIFRGNVRRWDALSLPNGRQPLQSPIWSVARLHCKVRPGHWRLILDREDQFSPSMNEVGSIPRMIQEVATYQDAIGYEVLWDIDHYEAVEGHKVKIIKIDGMSPGEDARVLAGDYPFYRTHSVAIWTDPEIANPLAEELIRYFERHMDTIQKEFRVIPAERLREAGWRFEGNEVVGGP